MATAKQQVQELLDEIPDTATLEDIQYHIYVREKIEKGLRDVEKGHAVNQVEIEKRMSQWLGK